MLICISSYAKLFQLVECLDCKIVSYAKNISYSSNKYAFYVFNQAESKQLQMNRHAAEFGEIVNFDEIKNTCELEAALNTMFSVENYYKLETRVFERKIKQQKRVKRIRTDLCCICMEVESTIMLSCGHECMCFSCSEKWKDCPMCRREPTMVFYS